MANLHVFAILNQTAADSGIPPNESRIQGLGISGYKVVCGDQQLTGNTTISAPSNAVLVIENGQLDTNGYTLQSTAGSGLTVVFTGSNNNTSLHIPSGGGTLDIAAPTSGAAWCSTRTQI